MTNDIVVRIATTDDLPSWMYLVELVRLDFPGLETEEALIGYKETVLQSINLKSAICAKIHDITVGSLLFSMEYHMLCFLAVHPDYRQRGIAIRMLDFMLTQLPKNHDIVVSTYREGDDKGTAARTLYKKFGFTEGELCYEFGYPVQKFVFHRSI